MSVVLTFISQVIAVDMAVPAMGAVNMQIHPIKAHNKHFRSVVRRQGRGYSIEV